MLDKVEYWLGLADEDISVAEILLNGRKYLQTGFFCHLVAEKALKAIIASVMTELPPKTHDLTKLAEIGGIYDSLTENQLDFLEELNPLNIEARYPDNKARLLKILTAQKTTKIIKETGDFLCWIKQRLGK
ncbi:MAG: HEPN domain-containing protein [Oscillospiraceae bacterium]|jgi:HEPN domain-containing protein|nr:HEPN domain-containing protein [Oscillospiraceae bacterium]